MYDFNDLYIQPNIKVCVILPLATLAQYVVVYYGIIQITYYAEGHKFYHLYPR